MVTWSINQGLIPAGCQSAPVSAQCVHAHFLLSVSPRAFLSGLCVTSYLKVFFQGTQFRAFPCCLQISRLLSTYSEFTISLPIQEGGLPGNREQAYITEIGPFQATYV